MAPVSLTVRPCVAREDYVGLGADHLELVDVAERPIIIAPRFQVLDATWRIVGMSLPTSKRCVEHTNIERVWLGRRVGEYEVFCNRRRRKALAMDRDGKFGKAMSPGHRDPNSRTFGGQGTVRAR